MWIDRKKDRQIDSQISRQLDTQIDKQINIQINRLIDRQIDRQIDTQIDKQIDTQVDRQIDRWQIDRYGELVAHLGQPTRTSTWQVIENDKDEETSQHRPGTPNVVPWRWRMSWDVQQDLMALIGNFMGIDWDFTGDLMGSNGF